MSRPEDNILVAIAQAFDELKEDVYVALRTQLGDINQLDNRIAACIHFVKEIGKVVLDCVLLYRLSLLTVSPACQHYT